MAHLRTMATELAPNPRSRGAARGRGGPDDVVDLTRIELRPAPEAIIVPGVLQADVPRRLPAVEPVGVRRLARGAVGVLLALLAPLLVVLLALSLPVDEAVQGMVLVAGWVGLGLAGRSMDGRDRRRHR